MSVDKLSEVRQLEADSAVKKEESRKRRESKISPGSLRSAQNDGYPERGTLRLMAAPLKLAQNEKDTQESLSFDDHTSGDSTSLRFDGGIEDRPKFFKLFKVNQPGNRDSKLAKLPPNVEDEQKQEDAVSPTALSPRRLCSFESNPRSLKQKLSLDVPKQARVVPFVRIQSCPADSPLTPVVRMCSVIPWFFIILCIIHCTHHYIYYHYN